MEEITLSKEELSEIKKSELEVLVEIDRICKKHNLKYSLAYGTAIGAIRHKGFIPWDDDIDILMKREDLLKFREVCKTELDDKFFLQNKYTDKEYYLLFDKIRVNDTVFKEQFYAKYNIHHGIFIDIFPIDRVPDNFFERAKKKALFDFFRWGVQTRYLDTQYRTGKKKYLSYLFKVLYAPFSLESLYSLAEKALSRDYNVQSENACMYVDARKNIYPSAFFEDTEDIEFEGHNFMIYRNMDKMLRDFYGDYMVLPPKEMQIAHHFLNELKL